jgi:hypothetical protein
MPDEMDRRKRKQATSRGLTSLISRAYPMGGCDLHRLRPVGRRLLGAATAA